MEPSRAESIIIADLLEGANLRQAIADMLVGHIVEVADSFVRALSSEGKILLFGNGGSAADAQHIAAELVGRFHQRERRGLPAIALSTNTSVVTAVGNDYGFEAIFARQVEALANANDVVVGLSTSGNSSNVIAGIQAAQKIGARTIALTGERGGRLSEVADLTVKVPSDNTPRIQEAHITIGHIICRLVEEQLFG